MNTQNAAPMAPAEHVSFAGENGVKNASTKCKQERIAAGLRRLGFKEPAIRDILNLFSDGSPQPDGGNQTYLRRSQAAKYVRDKYNVPCSPKTLAKLACVGQTGPPFRRAGRFPLYAPTDLDTWAQKKIGPLLRSTSDPGKRAA